MSDPDWSLGLTLAWDAEREGYLPEVMAMPSIEGPDWRESPLHRVVRIVEARPGEVYNCGVDGCEVCAVLAGRPRLVRQEVGEDG